MRYLFAALISFSSLAEAGQVFKCVDAAGKVTFTQGNCPEKNSFDSVVEAKNVAPSGSGPAVSMAVDNQERTSPQKKQKDGQAYTVVGERVETPDRLKEEPQKTTAPVYRSVPPQQRIVMEERMVVTHGRDKNGNRTAKVEVIKVPVVK